MNTRGRFDVDDLLYYMKLARERAGSRANSNTTESDVKTWWKIEKIINFRTTPVRKRDGSYKVSESKIELEDGRAVAVYLQEQGMKQSQRARIIHINTND